MRAPSLHSTSVLAALALSSLTAFAVDPLPTIAFDREGTIWTAQADGKNPKKLTNGDLPRISPDGASVAFTTNEPSEKAPVRHIAVADIASGKVTVVKGIPSDNSYGPVWSPDGKSVLFSTYVKEDWYLAFINVDGTGYRIVKDPQAKFQSFYEPCWAADGRSFFCHDLEAIYNFDLEGKLLKKWIIHTIVEHGDMSSNCRISVSPDGQSLLMEIEMDEDHKRENWDGPPPALWLLKLDAEKATRLTRKNFFAWDGGWLSNDEFIFTSQGAKENKPSIYRGSIKGTDYKLVLKNARTPSAPLK